MDKPLQKENGQGSKLPLLVLVMLVPLLMGALCTGGTPTPGTTNTNTTNTKTTNINDTTVKDLTITSFSQLKMLDANNGWATTPQLILKTTDGGKSWADFTPTDWKPQADGTPQTIQGIASANFVDANNAWIVAQTKTSQDTINAASTASSNIQKGYQNTGTVTVGNNTLPPIKSTLYVRSTIDGGRTWMTSNGIDVQNATGVSQPAFINEHEGWLEVFVATTPGTNSDSSGDIYHSVDGGITWKLQSSDQITVPGQPSGLTVVPDCAKAGSENLQLLPCATPPTSMVQGCTVTGSTQYLGLATNVQTNPSTLWLDQRSGTDTAWSNTNSVPLPSGAPGQTSDSSIAASPPIIFQDGTGILPVQIQGDPKGQNAGQFFLHLDEIKQTQSTQVAQVTDLSPTTTFVVSLIYGQHTLSASDVNNVYVVGQDPTIGTNGTAGDFNLYKFDGNNWTMIPGQTDGTIPAAANGAQIEPFNAGLSNLDFISSTEGWATNGPNVYHITIANNTATWSRVSSQVAPASTPGKVIPAPTNPPPCATSTTTVVTPPQPSGPASKFLHTFTFVNSTNQTIWVGATGTTNPNGGTWDGQLAPGKSNKVTVSTPSAELWSGRMWGRTGCTNGKCETGDCGTAALCGTGGAIPATLAEFALNGAAGLSYYDISLVDGFNLPMQIQASDGSPSPDNCGSQPCTDINTICPPLLQLLGASGVVGCKSACAAFGTDQYCCLGAYNSSTNCNTNAWPSDRNSAKLFKTAYPHAYSYAYDDATSTYTCSAQCNFTVTFGTSPAALASNRAVATNQEKNIPASMIIPPGAEVTGRSRKPLTGIRR